MITDDEYVRSLNEYRARVLGLPATTTDQWRKAVEGTDARDKAREFIQASLPAKPAAV